MPKVFISYSSKNKRRAIKLVNSLKDRGISVWFDQWDILVGHNIFDEIYKGIRECDYLCVILTKYSVTSKWVKEELDYAKQNELENKGTKIIPLLFENCEIPPSLVSKKYANFKIYDNGLEELFNKILKVDEAKVTISSYDKLSKQSNNLKLFQPIQQINSIRPDQLDDLFIGCSSFEERSTWCLNNYKSLIKNIIILEVGEYSSVNNSSATIKSKTIIAELRDRLIYKKGTFNNIFWSNFINLNELETIKKVIADILSSKGNKIVSIDITSLPAPYIIQLLRLLNTFQNLTIRMFYVSPQSYKLGTESFGYKRIQQIPIGSMDIKKDNLLIIIPGFSADIPNIISKYSNPDKTIILLPVSGEWNNTEKYFDKTFSRFIERPNVDLRKISQLDPFSIEEELVDLFEEYANYNWFIYPGGIKLQIIGIFQFIQKYPEVISSIFWAEPMKYSINYSVGTSNAWVMYYR